MHTEEPCTEDLTLAVVMAALSDPMRVAIVRQLTSDAPFSPLSSAPWSGVAAAPEDWRSVVGSVATGPTVVRATAVASVGTARVVPAVITAVAAT